MEDSVVTTGSTALDDDTPVENPETNINTSVDEPAQPDIEKSTPGKTPPSKIDVEGECSGPKMLTK